MRETNMTTETTIDTNELSPLLFVKNAMGYADTIKGISDLQAKQTAYKDAMIPFFKAHENDDWKTLGPIVKEALIKAEMADVTSKYGALKTCFEQKILPTDSHADRLRKAKTWISWTGKTVPNTYTAKHVDAKANLPIPNMIKTSEAVNRAAIEALEKSTAVIEAGKEISAVKASEKKGEIARPNVTASDSLTTSEHWDTLYAQFMKHGMTAFYIKALAGALATDESALFKTMTTVHNDLMTQAQKIEAKKK
jgi:hypothetical protein